MAAIERDERPEEAFKETADADDKFVADFEPSLLEGREAALRSSVVASCVSEDAR